MGPALGARLFAEFSAVERIFEAGPDRLCQVEGVGGKTARSLLDPSHRDWAQAEFERARELGVELISLSDPAYPPLLKELPDPPLLLYVRGSLCSADREAVAVVGSRQPDPYGESMAASLGSGLARLGVTVVSGMARGIDGTAQSAALKAGGRSLAVLGTGADVVYPREHQKLYDALLERGAVVSELPLGTIPDPGHFPRRNRIISGLSRGVVMVQAMSPKSGALITVRMALEQNREVYAVPGNAGSRGGRVANDLIKQGARLVETAEDVVADLRPVGLPAGAETDREVEELRTRELPELQARIYALVPGPAEGTVDLDALSRQLRVEAGRVAGAMLELELAGLVRALPGMRYVRLTS